MGIYFDNIIEHWRYSSAAPPPPHPSKNKFTDTLTLSFSLKVQWRDKCATFVKFTGVHQLFGGMRTRWKSKSTASEYKWPVFVNYVSGSYHGKG
jgi:hypothetical protein